MKIDRHTNWYEDWTDGSTETHVMIREGDAGAFPDEFKSAHSIELPFGTFIKMSVIIDNPEDKFVTVVFSNASNDAFIGKTHIANGVDVTNNDLPLMSLLDRWPMYTSLTLCNTHCDVSDGSTETTHTEAGAGGHGLGPNAKVDSENSLFGITEINRFLIPHISYGLINNIERDHHVEVYIGISYKHETSYSFSSSPNTILPVVKFGYRYQEPKNNLVFTCGIGSVNLLYIGLGYAF